MNISAEEFHIHFISYANIPFKAGIYASDLSIDWGDGTSSILKEKQYSNVNIIGKTILQHRPSLSARRTVSYQNFRPPDFKSECQPVKFSRFTTRTLSFFGISELFDQ